MCGIVGGFGFSDIEARMEKIRHRGIFPPEFAECDGFTFGHILLPLQSDGVVRQPVEDEEAIFTYNGEVWRDSFEGYDSDTFWLFNFLKTHSLRDLEDVKGMFGFSLYLKKNNTLLLARDYLGGIPLYYYCDGNRFLYGSELKCFYGLPLKQVSLVPPGFWVLFRPGVGYKLIRYHELSSIPVTDSQGTIVQRFASMFSQAVRERLTSRLPLCTLLSGGIDSLLVSYVAHKYHPSITAYTVSLEGQKSTDLVYAREEAEWLGVHLTECTISGGSLDQVLGWVVYACESPVWTQIASAAGQWVLGKQLAIDGYRACLSGEGSDEIFGSYPEVKRWRWRPEQYEYERRKLLLNVGSNNLIRSNKLLMASGTVELRTPFCDRTFVEYAGNVPVEYRYMNHKMKPLLRYAFEGEIPDRFLWREKVCMGAGTGFDPVIRYRKETILHYFNSFFNKDGIIQDIKHEA
jgi:asparagine synthase (glutamine-hydrolysing)